MSVPGTLSIIKSINNRQLDNEFTKPLNEKTNFELNFKLKEKNLTFELNGSFYLYHKEYPTYDELSSSDLKNYIRHDIRKERSKIYSQLKKEKNDGDSDIDYSQLNKETDEEFRKYLEHLVNKKNNKNISIIINKIIFLLKPEFLNKLDNIDYNENEGHADIENEEIGSELIERETKGFIFNHEDFDSISDYQSVINILSANNKEIYNNLFVDLKPNFIYKKTKFEIEPIKIDLDIEQEINNSTDELNIKIGNTLFKDISEKILNFIKKEKICLDINSPLSFFDYI